MRIKALIALCVGIVLATSSLANIPDPLQPPRLVNDFANLLSDSQREVLERKLLDYHDSTSTQIYVVTVSSLDGYDVGDFAFRLGEKWGVGQKGKDNGVVMVIKPRNEEGSGEVFLATGYGLEDIIPDAIAKRIVELELIPHFREDDIYGGIVAATTVIMDLASGKFSADEYGDEGSILISVLTVFLLMLIFVLGGIFKGAKKNVLGGKLPLGAALGMAMRDFTSSSGGSYSSFSSGSGSFGGFKGGGGGSFGGGGAGGRW